MSVIFDSESLYEKGVTSFFIDVLLIPIILIGLTLLISSLAVSLFKTIHGSKIDFESKIRHNIEAKEKKASTKDLERKISHVLIFLAFLGIWIIGFYSILNSEHPEQASEGMIPENNNMLEIYINLMARREDVADIILSFGWFYYLIFFFMYIFALIMIVNEISRKNKYISFPFTLVPKLVLAEDEKQNFGTYLFFAVGQMWAAFSCPPMIYLSILGMSGLADLMTSQIGIRYGNHKIPWNSKKSWEGTIAGVLTALILCYLFIGLIWAIIFSITFLLIDISTRKPLNASDNLLIPIGCSIVFLLVRFFFHLSYVHPFINV